jgi:hypothetical protein
MRVSKESFVAGSIVPGFGDVRCHSPRLIAREQLGGHNRAARSTQLSNFSAKLFGKGASDQ